MDWYVSFLLLHPSYLSQVGWALLSKTSLSGTQTTGTASTLNIIRHQARRTVTLDIFELAIKGSLARNSHLTLPDHKKKEREAHDINVSGE